MINNLVAALEECETGKDIVSVLSGYENSGRVKVFRGIDKDFFEGEDFLEIVSENEQYLVLIGEVDSFASEQFSALVLGDLGYIVLNGESGLEILEKMVDNLLEKIGPSKDGYIH